MNSAFIPLFFMCTTHYCANINLNVRPPLVLVMG